MKNVTMISRRSFLKAAMAASAVSALAFTGCGGSASSTVAASSTASSAAASAAAEGGQTFKVGIVNYVDHASLNQIVESVESRLDELGAEKGVTFDYADYYANAQADQSNLNQIGADLVGDGVDVIVAVATPTAATMLAAVEDTDIPVVYSAVTDPAAAGFDGGENMTGTSDALNTAAIMNLILAADPEIDTIGPEPELAEAAADYRAEAKRRKHPILAAVLISLLPVIPMGIEAYGYEIRYWTGDAAVQSGVLLACLAAVAVLARQVFAKAFGSLLQKRCTSELLAVVSALVMAADCVARLVLPERSAVPCYAPVGCLALVFAMWGGARESRGLWDTFRMAATDDEPPYLVTETEKGACKQAGSVPGFYTTALRENTAAVWQNALMPVVLMASIVFAGLSSLGQERGDDFLLNWSAILGAGTTFALPLCWGMPFSRLARHFHKAGCAVAGWCGAEKISRRRAMILTDGDLFPPGTIQLNGVKVFGEDLSRVSSYAASMARAADCGLQRLFDGLLRSEGGHYEKVDDFSFYEEGGYSATIRGESVLLGTASFMRKMEVRLPGGINLRTGIFLAMDRQLAAVFAVKYQPSENVDFALRMMRRSRITPILASRDPNITPALLKRKFHKGVKVEFPSLTDRVAFSEAELDRGMPRALLFREGLLPYAEAVVGSRRLCKAVRRATALSVLGSVAGTLLSFYMVFQGAYNLLTPLALLVFLLLWALPVLLLADWAGRY